MRSNKKKGLYLLLISLSSFLTIGCDSADTTASIQSNEETSFSTSRDSSSQYPYQHEDYQGKETATYREYYSYETGELIRLFENNTFEYIYGDIQINRYVNFCGPYFSLEFDNSTSYINDEGKQCRNVDESVFLFLYNTTSLNLVSKYCVYSSGFHFLDTKYDFVYEGNTNPPYHYPKKDLDFFEFCYFLKPEIQDQQEAVELLGIQNYAPYIEGFSAAKNSNCTKLFLKLPSSSFTSLISVLFSIDNTYFYQAPVYYLVSSGSYSIINIDHYGLTPSNQIKDAFLYATLLESGHENTIFDSFDSLERYIIDNKDKIGGPSFFGATSATITTIYNTIDRTIFDSYNLVLTNSLFSPVVEETTFYNASYIKNGIITITFDSINYVSGAAAISYRAYLITIPKDYSVNEIRVIK